jgi:3-hydroxyanthranilate 3,4-dioxygenase
MSIRKPFHLKNWVEEHRHLLKPPVGNQQIYHDNGDYIVMVVGGPNARKDFHYNESEELFYQLEGTITLQIIEENTQKSIEIQEGEMFLLPAKIPHLPQRPANTVGLVIERYRKIGEKDGCLWFCEHCKHKLHEEYFAMTDIVKQLPEVMHKFYSSEDLRTCKNCNSIMQKP